MNFGGHFPFRLDKRSLGRQLAGSTCATRVSVQDEDCRQRGPRRSLHGGQAERLPLAPRQASASAQSLLRALWPSLQLAAPSPNALLCFLQTLLPRRVRPRFWGDSSRSALWSSSWRWSRSPLSCCRPFSVSPQLWSGLGLSPRPGVLPLSGGLSCLWLFHVSCFPLFPCAVKESSVRPAASPSFPVPGRCSWLGSACLCSRVCSFFPGSAHPIFILGHFSPSSLSSVSLWFRALWGTPNSEHNDCWPHEGWGPNCSFIPNWLGQARVREQLPPPHRALSCSLHSPAPTKIMPREMPYFFTGCVTYLSSSSCFAKPSWPLLLVEASSSH